MHWLLSPVDHHARIWQTYSVQRLVVEASDEQEARQKVADAAAAAALEEPNPWLDPAMTRCEETTAPMPS
jgi:hypothetical protein